MATWPQARRSVHVQLLAGESGVTWLTSWRQISQASQTRSGAKPSGEVDVLGFLRGFARQPLVTLRAALGARRALMALEALV